MLFAMQQATQRAGLRWEFGRDSTMIAKLAILFMLIGTVIALSQLGNEPGSRFWRFLAFRRLRAARPAHRVH
jgi:hypothetical protein